MHNMTRAELATKVAQLRAENTRLERVIELSREHVKLQGEAQARQKAARQRASLSVRSIYAKHNAAR